MNEAESLGDLVPFVPLFTVFMSDEGKSVTDGVLFMTDEGSSSAD